MCFYLLHKYKKLEEVQKRVAFTTHTPEKAGNEEHSMPLLHSMSFFNGLTQDEVNDYVYPENGMLNYTLTALRLLSSDASNLQFLQLALTLQFPKKLFWRRAIR
jgi:starch phosphorylase